MKKLLWVGDAHVASGFAKATHQTIRNIKGYEPYVLGLNYRGDPHPYPYSIYPCWPYGDGFGLNRIGHLCWGIKPDVIVLQNDPWNIPPYLQALHDSKVDDIPVVGTIAVDGLNCNGAALNGLNLALFWTKFGEEQAVRGGYMGPHGVVPLGVDLKMYRPMIKSILRRSIVVEATSKADKVGPDSFVVLNVNRNQYRKRLDLTVQYFCEWVLSKNIEDAFLMFHACPTGEQEYDIENLMEFYGLRRRLILIKPEIGYGIPEQYMSSTYNLADTIITTTMGEGLGLTTLEAMACGIPPIIPDFAALGEICEDAALKVTCTSFAANKKGINTIGGIADRNSFIDALHFMYTEPKVRETLSERSKAIAAKDCYRWENIGAAFEAWLDVVTAGKPEESLAEV